MPALTKAGQPWHWPVSCARLQSKRQDSKPTSVAEPDVAPPPSAKQPVLTPAAARAGCSRTRAARAAAGASLRAQQQQLQLLLLSGARCSFGMAAGQLLSGDELELALLAKFHAAVAAGLTRTKDVTKTRWAVLGPPGRADEHTPPGSPEWVRASLTAQFNEEHIAAKRKSHMHAAAAPPSVVTPFDPARFHFGKVDPAEVLFAVRLTEEGCARLALEVPRLAATALLQGEPAALCGGEAARTGGPAADSSCSAACATEAGPDAGADERAVWHPVLVNASPICVPHALLVPWPGLLLPQVMTLPALRLALATAAMPGAASLRLAFNSLGAWSSVNHLHWHVIPASFSGRTKGAAAACAAEGVAGPTVLRQAALPVEASPRGEEAAAVRGGLRVSAGRLDQWPAGGVYFEATDGAAAGPRAAAGSAATVLAELAFPLVHRLQAGNVPHNLLVCGGGRRLVVFPRRPQGRTGDGSLNVAALEICGRGVVNLEEGWDPLTAAGLAAQLREVRLPAAALDELCGEAASLVRAWEAAGGAAAGSAVRSP